jgi:hypothetical protein
MYKLTLTAGERAAFDWIGHRYAHGSDMLRLIWVHGKIISPDPETVEDIDDPRDITFEIPEAAAWEIRFLTQQDEMDPCPYQWDCFAPELAAKMQKFIDEII